jgi:hypothetical protein
LLALVSGIDFYWLNLLLFEVIVSVWGRWFMKK